MNKKIFTVLSICAAAVSLISLFMPFLSVEFFGSYSESGVELLSDVFDYIDYPAGGMVVALGAALISLIFCLVALANDKISIVSAIFSIGAMVAMFIGLSEDMDYAAVGFYMFEAAQLAVVVLSLVSVCYKNGSSQSVTANHVSPAAPSANGGIAARYCVGCGTPLSAEAKFCPNCGKQLQ